MYYSCMDVIKDVMERIMNECALMIERYFPLINEKEALQSSFTDIDLSGRRNRKENASTL